MNKKRIPIRIFILAPDTINHRFRFLWLKHVKGFRPSRHCSECLIGDYLLSSSAKGLASCTKRSRVLETVVEEGEILYLCGVDAASKHDRNIHLPMVAREGGSCMLTGERVGVLVDGATPIPFNENAARTMYPELGEEFLSCRNFQFGAQLALIERTVAANRKEAN